MITPTRAYSWILAPRRQRERRGAAARIVRLRCVVRRRPSALARRPSPSAASPASRAAGCRARLASRPSSSATSSPSRITRIRVHRPQQLLDLRRDDDHAEPVRGEVGDDAEQLGLGRRRRRLGSARRAAARGTRAAATARAPPSAGCRRRARAPSARRPPAWCAARAACSSAAARSARTLISPRWKRPTSASVTFLVRLHSSSSACDLRSSGASPSPAAIALSGRPGGRGTPSTSTSPASRRSTPYTARSSSLRPTPTSPAMPSTSPARSSNVAGFTSGRRAQPAHAQHHVVAGERALGEQLLELAARPCASPARRRWWSAGRPEATVRPSLRTVTRSPIRRISSRRCEM